MFNFRNFLQKRNKVKTAKLERELKLVDQQIKTAEFSLGFLCLAKRANLVSLMNCWIDDPRRKKLFLDTEKLTVNLHKENIKIAKLNAQKYKILGKLLYLSGNYK